MLIFRKKFNISHLKSNQLLSKKFHKRQCTTDSKHTLHYYTPSTPLSGQFITVLGSQTVRLLCNHHACVLIHLQVLSCVLQNKKLHLNILVSIKKVSSIVRRSNIEFFFTNVRKLVLKVDTNSTLNCEHSSEGNGSIPLFSAHRTYIRVYQIMKTRLSFLYTMYCFVIHTLWFDFGNMYYPMK